MCKVILMVLVVFVNVGCISTTTTTGIVKVSEDTYMIGKQDGRVWTAAEIKVGLYKEANAFCEKDGKKFVQVSNTGADFGSSYANAEIQFKCQ